MLALSLLIAASAATAEGAATTSHGRWELTAEPGRVAISQRGSAAWNSGTPELIVRCRVWEEEGKWFGKHKDKEAYVYYPAGFPSETGDVFVSLDGGAPKKHWVSVSTDGKSYFLRTNMDNFIRSLREHEKLTLVVKPDKQEPYPEISFALPGFGEALTPFVEQCPLKEKKGK
jgi:invasion protein IalB